MDDKTLCNKLLGLTSPWGVETVKLKLDEGEVYIRVVLPPKEQWVCPECLERAPIHDHRDRSLRHLNTLQYRTILDARVPRLRCPTHGIKQILVPWVEEGSRFTTLFEALVILWLRKSTLEAVARCTGTTWDHVWAVAMDMWSACINSTLAHPPGAAEKIVFDKFHIAEHLIKAVDEVHAHVVHRITDAGSVSINFLIRNVKRKARGYCGRENFRTAIMFHFGGVDLLPDGA